MGTDNEQPNQQPTLETLADSWLEAMKANDNLLEFLMLGFLSGVAQWELHRRAKRICEEAQDGQETDDGPLVLGGYRGIEPDQG